MTLPDTTPIRVFPCLGESYVSTLGELLKCDVDARLFGAASSLAKRGEWRCLGLTVRLELQGV